MMWAVQALPEHDTALTPTLRRWQPSSLLRQPPQPQPWPLLHMGSHVCRRSSGHHSHPHLPVQPKQIMSQERPIRGNDAPWPPRSRDSAPPPRNPNPRGFLAALRIRWTTAAGQWCAVAQDQAEVLETDPKPYQKPPAPTPPRAVAQSGGSHCCSPLGADSRFCRGSHLPAMCTPWGQHRGAERHLAGHQGGPELGSMHRQAQGTGTLLAAGHLSQGPPTQQDGVPLQAVLEVGVSARAQRL